MLSVKSPKPARFPAYTIENEAGEVLATVPITASGGSYKLALAMAAAPDLATVLLASLPFVEDGEADPAYKVGAVKKLVAAIRAALVQAGAI